MFDETKKMRWRRCGRGGGGVATSVALIALATTSGLTLVGCGGGGGANPLSGKTGASLRGVTVSVAWPTAKTRKVHGRDLPVSTNSIKLTVTDSGEYSESQILNKPETGSTTATATFVGLRAGTIQVTATAYSGPNATGTVVDTASGSTIGGTGADASLQLTFADVAYHGVQVNFPTGSSTVIPIGQTLALSATGIDANGLAISSAPGTWTSSNASIATVSSTGLVTAVKPGTATITFTSGTLTSSLVVTSQGLVAVALTPTGAQTIDKGATVAFTAHGTLTTGTASTSAPAGTWASSSTAVATVSATGVVTGVAPGKTTITFKDSTFGLTATANVTVSGLVSVAVTPGPTDTLAQFGALALTATGTDANGASVPSPAGTWTTSSAAIASVSVTGAVIGVAPGTATITFTDSTYGQKASVTVTVPATPIASIVLSPNDTQTVLQGTTGQITATAYDAANHVLSVSPAGTWTSSAPTIVSVSATGAVKALLPGSATITFTDSTYNKSASVPFIVKGGDSEVTVQ